MVNNWDISKEDFDLAVQIADRAVNEFTVYPLDKRTLIMDLNACHANGCPLDFKSLLEASVLEFSHDIYGISKSINRDTGKLEEHFRPRYARSNHVVTEEN